MQMNFFFFFRSVYKTLEHTVWVSSAEMKCIYWWWLCHDLVCLLLSGDPSVPLAAAAWLHLLHLVYLCSHSGKETVQILDERESQMLSIFNLFFFPTFLLSCRSSYMMKRLFGKSSLRNTCIYRFHLQSHSRWPQLILQVGSSHLDSDVFPLHFDYEVSHNIKK